MTVLTVGGLPIMHQGAVAVAPAPGAPAVALAFTHSVDPETMDLTVMLDAVLDGATHWRPHLVLGGARTGRNRPLIEATTDPVNLGDINELFGRGLEPGEIETLTLQLIPVNELGDGRPGRAVPIVIGPPPPPDIEVDEAPTLAAVRVDDTITRTPPVTSVPPAGALYVLQVSDDGETGWADYGSDPVTAPGDTAAKYLRDVWTITGPAGDTVLATSNVIGPIEALPDIPDLVQIVADDVLVTGSYYRCGGTMWFAPVMILAPWLAGMRVRFTTTDPALAPNDGPGIDWLGYVEPIPGEDGLHSLWMADPETHCVLGPPPQDRALFRADHPLPRGRLRLAYQPLASDPESDPWSPVSLPAWFIPVPDVPAPDPDVLEWRQILFRSPAMFGVTPTAPHLYPNGWPGGDFMQWLPGVGQWSADGTKLLVGQDSNQIMIFPDQGETCYRPRAAGLTVNGVSSVLWDATDNDRFLILAGPTPQQLSTKAGEGGIFLSTDNGETLTRVLAITNAAPGRFDWASNNFARHGSTVWLIANRYTAASTDQPLAFCRSTTNGSTWEIVNEPAFSLLGRVRQMDADPNNASRLFIGSSSGFWRSTTAGATTGSWSRNWTTGLPVGANVGAFWIDPDDSNHMLVAIRSENTAHQGVWETTNGTHFVRIRAVNAHHLSVGAKDADGNRTLYVQPRGGPTGDSSPHIRLRDGTWIVRGSGSPRINVNFRGLQSDWWPAQGLTFPGSTSNSGGAQQHTWISAHPTDPDLAVGHFVTTIMRTGTGGRDLVLAGAGFGGLNGRAHAVQEGNRMRVVFTAHDTGLELSDDGLDTSRIISFGAGGFKARAQLVIGNQASFRGRKVLYFPDDDRLPPEWRGRIVFGAGGSATASGVLGYVNAGENVIRDWLGSNPQSGQSNASGGGAAHRETAGMMLDDPRKAWIGPNRINLATQSQWTTAQGGRLIIGAAQDGTDIIYGFDSGQSGTILRSENFGTSWSPFHTFGSNVIGQINPGVPLGHHASLFDGRRMFFRPGVRTLAMVWDNAGTAQVTSWNLNHLFDGISPLPADAVIVSVAQDALDPRWIYLLTGAIGYGRKKFRGKFNSTYTEIAWEEIASNGPENSAGGDVFTDRVSGDVVFNFDGIGKYPWPAPEDWQPRCGAFRFSGQPGNGSTLSINGETITFVTGTPTGLQVQIGGSRAVTLGNLATRLNASAVPAISKCTYTVVGDRLDVTIDNPAVNAEEDVPLSASGTPNAVVAFAARPWKRFYWSRMPMIAKPRAA